MRRMQLLVLGGIILGLAAAGAFADSGWLKGTTEEQLKTLADLQPGLGTVMIEYSTRYTNLYYAANGGNWDLAAYELKEAREIQEVGETTRPGRAAALKTFEKSAFDPLEAAIKAKDLKKFEEAFQKGVQRCNGCHVAQGFAYIKYQLPGAPTLPLSMKKP